MPVSHKDRNPGPSYPLCNDGDTSLHIFSFARPSWKPRHADTPPLPPPTHTPPQQLLPLTPWGVVDVTAVLSGIVDLLRISALPRRSSSPRCRSGTPAAAASSRRLRRGGFGATGTREAGVELAVTHPSIRSLSVLKSSLTAFSARQAEAHSRRSDCVNCCAPAASFFFLLVSLPEAAF